MGGPTQTCRGNALRRAVDRGACLAVWWGWISLHTLMAFTVTVSPPPHDFAQPALDCTLFNSQLCLCTRKSRMHKITQFTQWKWLEELIMGLKKLMLTAFIMTWSRCFTDGFYANRLARMRCSFYSWMKNRVRLKETLTEPAKTHVIGLYQAETAAGFESDPELAFFLINRYAK